MNKEPGQFLLKILIFLSIYAAVMIPLSSRTAAIVEASDQQISGEPINQAEADIPKPQEVTEPPKQVTLALVGDILMDSWVGNEIKNKGVDYPWVQVKDILRGADLAIGNLESSVGVGGSPIRGKSFTFRARPETLQGVVNAGIDVVSLANNHVLDYGTSTFAETLNNLDKYKIARAGGGRNVYEAISPTIQERNGLKIGVLSFSRVVPYPNWVAGTNQPGVANGWDNKLVLDTIKGVDPKVDILVVSIHWGTELADYPASDQTTLAKAMVDSGADVILGHHPHCLQGVAVYKNKPILYSVGNFVFTSSSVKARTGAIGLMTMDKKGLKELQMIPTRLDRGQPQVLQDKVKVGEIIRLQQLSKPFGTQFNNEGKVYHKEG